MGDRPPTAIPALMFIAGAVSTVTLIAMILRLSRPVHLDDVDRRVLRSDGTAAIDTRLNLNQATAAELSLLPGVGLRLAGRIVEYRMAHGPFRSLQDLQQVPGIGERIVERLHAHAVTDPIEMPAGSIALAPDDPTHP